MPFSFRLGFGVTIVLLQILCQSLCVGGLRGVLDDAPQETIGAVLQKHRLIAVKEDGDGATCDEGAGDGLVGGEDEESVTLRYIVGGKGDFKVSLTLVAVDDVKDFVKEVVVLIHVAYFWLYSVYCKSRAR